MEYLDRISCSRASVGSITSSTHYILSRLKYSDVFYGKSAATCRIEVRRTTLVPPQSGIWLPVDIPGSENLTSHGFAEPVPPKKSTLSMIPGVLDLREKVVSVVNCTEEPITLHANQLIGTCESYTDSEQSGRVHLIKKSFPVNPEESASSQLPEHLQCI